MDNYFLMNSHVSPILIIVSYLTVLNLGPIVMNRRKAFDLKKFLIAYNVSQIFFNFYLFTQAISVVFETGVLCTTKYELKTELLTTSTLMDLHHKYLLLKVYDLIDTVLFVLRKKSNQVSFFHVYHHVTVFLFVWSIAKYFPATSQLPVGPGVFFGLWNTLVHTIMYTYYLLSAVMGDSVKSSWWKKYITLLQLVQHCSLFALGLITLTQKDCPFPKYMVIMAMSLITSMIYLFGSFYFKTYIRKRNSDDGKLKAT